MPKRGQTKILLFIALLVALGLALAVLLRSPAEEFNLLLQEKVLLQQEGQATVHQAVTECVEELGELGLFLWGEHGGYLVAPKDFEGTLGTLVYRHGQLFVPDITRSERELEAFLTAVLPSYCQEATAGFEVVDAIPKAAVRILPQEVQMQVEWPLTLSQLGEQFPLPPVDITVPLELPKLVSAMGEIAEEQQRHPWTICLSCLEKVAQRYDLEIRMANGAQEVGLVLVDQASRIGGGKYAMAFALAL